MSGDASKPTCFHHTQITRKCTVGLLGPFDLKSCQTHILVASINGCIIVLENSLVLHSEFFWKKEHHKRKTDEVEWRRNECRSPAEAVTTAMRWCNTDRRSQIIAIRQPLCTSRPLTPAEIAPFSNCHQRWDVRTHMRGCSCLRVHSALSAWAERKVGILSRCISISAVGRITASLARQAEKPVALIFMPGDEE